MRFAPTHNLLVSGNTHRVKRVRNYWVNAAGEQFYVGFAEPIAPSPQPVDNSTPLARRNP